MEIKPTYIDFEQAKLLKNVNFNTPCMRAYRVWRGQIRKGDKNPLEEIGVEYEPYEQFPHAEIRYFYYGDSDYILAPEQWQVIEFFRVKYNVFVEINPNWDNGNIDYYDATIYHDKIYNVLCGKKTPQEAYSEAINYVLQKLISSNL